MELFFSLIKDQTYSTYKNMSCEGYIYKKEIKIKYKLTDVLNFYLDISTFVLISNVKSSKIGSFAVSFTLCI